MTKLVIKVFGDPGEDICDLEQAEYYLNFDEQIVVIDRQPAHSLEEFLKIVSQEKYRSQDLIEVMQIPAITGG